MKIKYIFLQLLFAINLFPQQGEFRNLELGNPDFQFEILFFKSNTSVDTRVDVFVQIPYDNLKFIKENLNLVSRYEVTISVLNMDDDLVLEKLWSEEINEKEFQKKGEKLFAFIQKSFELVSGKYKFQLKVRDEVSGKISTKKITSEVTKFGVNNLELSDYFYLNKFRKENEKIFIVPNITSNINEMEDGLALYFEIYSKKCNDSLIITYKIKGNDKKILFDSSESRNCVDGKNKILVNLRKIKLPIGEYQCEITVQNKIDKIVKTKKIISRRGSSGIMIKDLELAIKQLKYIAKNEEYNFLTENGIEESVRQDRFNSFWKKRDPNPETEENEYFEEYYFRVEYANKTFSHYNDGWRTDRGMVFIIFGMPNNIERHPFEINTKPSEVWTYFEFNRQLVFIDDTGFGDYRLITPIWDLLNRIK